MRSKYDVGQKVYFFEPNEERVVCQEVEMVFATAEGVFYRLDKVSLPEAQVFSCELQCLEHYRKIFL